MSCVISHCTTTKGTPCGCGHMYTKCKWLLPVFSLMWQTFWQLKALYEPILSLVRLNYNYYMAKAFHVDIL